MHNRAKITAAYRKIMKRREFLRTSVSVSALVGVGVGTLGAVAAEGEPEMTGGGTGLKGREYYELRRYRLKTGASHELLDRFLQNAAIPAWNRLGINPVGVFVQQERSGSASGTEVREPDSVFVLLPYPSLGSFAVASARINQDPEYQQAGHDYLQTSKDNPAFDRIDSWLLLAFAGMPRLELAAYSRERKPRMFELRTYESFSEVKALKKIEMFNSGEIETMRHVGLAPVFYGQALIGENLPHLTYMLSAENQEEHKKHWAAFSKHPVWTGLNKDPQYADTVSKIRNRFLVPASYSQI